VLRAHGVQPHFDEVCLALTWRSFLGCNFCSPIVGAGTRGVIVRRPTMFRQSLVASTTDRRTQSPRDNKIDAFSEFPLRRWSQLWQSHSGSTLEAFSDPDALGDLLRPNMLSVGVRRNMISRSTLVTATTRTGKPCISFSLNATAESDKWWFVVCRVPRDPWRLGSDRQTARPSTAYAPRRTAH
jgi:hypothetical protein